MKKRKTFYFFTDLYRLLTRKETYLSVAGVALTLFFAVGSWEELAESVIYTLLLSTYSAGFILSFVFCALPYGSVYSEELENNYIRYAVNRGGLMKYIISKNLVIFLSSVLAMGLGCLLFAVIVSFHLPWIDAQTYETFISFCGYRDVLDNGNYVLWVALYGIQWGIFGGCLSLISSWLSLYISNKLFVLAMPALLYQIIVELGANTFRKNSLLDPRIIFDARNNLFSDDVKMFLWAGGAGVLTLTAVTAAVYQKMQKRM
ncbi:MAG: hypothetical protein HFH51_09790 [Lachnospiraceae bacterium]|mgnify:CR=1 FL=1|nr:hypothetical protein [Lachnospiraceae bacterium]